MPPRAVAACRREHEAAGSCRSRSCRAERLPRDGLPARVREKVHGRELQAPQPDRLPQITLIVEARFSSTTTGARSTAARHPNRSSRGRHPHALVGKGDTSGRDTLRASAGSSARDRREGRLRKRSSIQTAKEHPITAEAHRLRLIYANRSVKTRGLSCQPRSMLQGLDVGLDRGQARQLRIAGTRCPCRLFRPCSVNN